MKTGTPPNADADDASRPDCPDVCGPACCSADEGCGGGSCADGAVDGRAVPGNGACGAHRPPWDGRAPAPTGLGDAGLAEAGRADAPSFDPIVEAIRRRAENLFDTRQLLCAEAVLHAVAETLGGPLSPDQAAALGTPFCQGMGGAGCTCGALSGAVA
ncbi:C_GCAxxG_C_C family protein, partial [Desulfovibrio oxamicus]